MVQAPFFYFLFFGGGGVGYNSKSDTSEVFCLYWKKKIKKNSHKAMMI